VTFYGPVLWFKLRDRLRRTWRVEFSCPTLTPTQASLAGGCDGFCDNGAHKVVIDIRNKWAKQQEVLLHELGHVAASEREGVPEKTEEQAVYLVATPLLHILLKPPFSLVLPPRPAEWAKFRRWARFVDG